jgi:uncharacterized protein YciI
MNKEARTNLFKKVPAFSIVIILSLVLIAPVFSGCGGGAAASNTFMELLNLIPADATTGEVVFFTLVDHASFYKDNSITFTTPEELINEVIGTPSLDYIMYGELITGYGNYMMQSTIRKEYVGYDVTCVDAEIQFGMPPNNGVAAIGRFSPGDTENAFKNQSEWPSWAKTAYATENYRGVTIHSWGSGLETHMQTTLRVPHIDQLGRARPLAVTDRYLFYAASVEAVKQLIDASQDQRKSLADLPEYAAIADGLADLKAYNAIIGDAKLANGVLSQFEDPDSQVTPEHLEYLENRWIKLKNFLTFGSGVGIDEKGTYTAIVIYHENSADATANVALLTQRIENEDSALKLRPWRDMISDYDIRAEGNILVAKLYTSDSFWAQWVYSQDNLLLHED